MKRLRPAALVALAALAACKSAGARQDDTALKVVNGAAADTDAFRAIVFLDARSLGGVTCTGTFLNATTLITAAHCVYSWSNFQLVGTYVNGYLSSASYVADTTGFPALLQECTGQCTSIAEFTRRDIAIVVFPAAASQSLGIGAGGFWRLHTQYPAVGDTVSIVGFGLRDATDAASGGTRTWGTNTLREVTTEALSYYSAGPTTPGQNVSAAKGDSGGPLLVRDPATGFDRLVGVTSLVPGANAGWNYAPSLRSGVAKGLFEYAINCPAPGPCAAPFAY